MLEFIYRDDHCKPGEAVKIAEELMTRDVGGHIDRHNLFQRRSGDLIFRRQEEVSMSRSGAPC